jgi:ATP-dependent DNA helicase RecQ
VTATDDAASALLQKHWGFDEFRPGQRQVIDALIRGESAAAVFPTGGGKSLCYQLPALMLDGLTVVVSPLIALMKDQIDALAARGIRARRLDSSLEPGEARAVVSEVRAGTLPLLYVAPERFNNERFREMLSGVKMALFAVDEAHCISEWGHNFRPDYLKLVRFARAYQAERVLALTATATPAVLEDICRQFEITPDNAVRTPFYRANLTLLCQPAETASRERLLRARLKERPAGATIIYVTRQRTAEDLAAMLARDGYDAVAYHAGLGAEERGRIQDHFMQSEAGIVAATIAFGMGVDKSDIRYVYHYNLPKSIEGYSQEIGRAGRDGATSICESFVCPDDIHALENFAHGDTPSRGAVASLLEALFEALLEDPPTDGRLEVSHLELANTHDIRPLVVRTLLTYLELDGFLEAGTPFYQSYRFKPRVSSAEILAAYTGAKHDQMKRILARSKKARTWFTLDVDAAVQALGVTRASIVASLDELHDRDFIELSSSGMRHPYAVVKRPASLDELTDDLHARTVDRERRELGRIAGVLAQLSGDSCQVGRLGGHFGESLPAACGHCTVCLDGPVPTVAAANVDRAFDDAVFDEVAALGAEAPKHARALSEPRAVARFLCGLPSPAVSRARLTRHRLFGALSDIRFGTVLDRASARA